MKLKNLLSIKPLKATNVKDLPTDGTTTKDKVVEDKSIEVRIQEDSTSTTNPKSTSFLKRKKNIVLALLGFISIVSIALIFILSFVVFGSKGVSFQPHRQVYETLTYAVKDIKVVEGKTQKAAIEECESHLNSQWTVAGVSLIDMDDQDKYVYLCQERVNLASLNLNDNVVKRIDIFQDAESCPGIYTTNLFVPRVNTVICMEYISVQLAVATKVFVGNIVTTRSKYYNNDRPGWQTLPTSVHVAVESEEEGIYLSYSRPSLSVRELQFVQNTTLAAAWESCTELTKNLSEEESDLQVWEPAGTGYIDTMDSQVALLCTRVHHVAVGDEQKVLLDIHILHNVSSPCPKDYHKLKLPVANSDSNGFILCLRWGSLYGTEATLGDLALTRIQSDVKETIFPGQWSRLAPDLNEETNGFSSYIIYRKSYFAPMLRDPISPKRTSRRSYDDLDHESTATGKANDKKKNIDLFARVPLDGFLSFKVLQLADLHFIGNPNQSCSDVPQGMAEEDCSENLMHQFISNLLDVEQPDLVVFTGDNIHGDRIDSEEQLHLALDAFSQVVEKRGVPWAMVFGNHDEEGEGTNEEMLEYLRSTKKYIVAERGPRDVDGVGNYELNVHAPVDGPWGSKDGDVFRMYFLDSHGYTDTSTYPLTNSNYGWVKQDQIDFYKGLARSHASGDTKQEIPAVMFFHIPLPEYDLAMENLKHGDRFESVHAPQVNTGLFSALVEMGDVKGVFVGHDHTNEYCYKREGINLCYGGGAGFGVSYGDSTFSRRARVIEWSQDVTSGVQTVTSWKRHFDDLSKRYTQERLFESSR